MPAEMPSTKNLTELVLGGVGWRWHTDSCYSKSSGGTREGENCVKAITKYLRLIREEIFAFYHVYHKDESTFNYEVLFYVITQIDDSLQGEFENPALHSLIEAIKPKAEAILAENALNSWDFYQLSRETKQYVKCVLISSLSKAPASRSHMDLLVNACKAHPLDINVFTLNHDRVVEDILRERGVRFVDGFGESKNGVRYWEPEIFESLGCVKYLKLHGSIDWHEFYSGEIGIVENGDYEHAKNVAGDWLSPMGTAKILVGTFNKLLSYAGGIFSELYYQFYRELKTTDVLIVSGYSFGDKGINSRIKEWLNSKKGRRMIVLHKEPESLKNYARGAIKKSWDAWRGSGTLICVEKWLCEATWSEIKTAIKVPITSSPATDNDGQSITSDI